MEELREIRRVMEELVEILKIVASGLGRGEAVRIEEKKEEVKTDKDCVGAEESQLEEEEKVKGERKVRKEHRKVEVSSMKKGEVMEARKDGREQSEGREKIREEGSGEKWWKRRRGRGEERCYGGRGEEDETGKGEE